MTEEIGKLLKTYQDLKLDEVLDHQKFNEYAIVHHSTGMEGSSLTETETRLLLDENLTPKGKPLEHSLMVKDHFEALQFTLQAAAEKQPITTAFIQVLNAHVMKNTGGFYETAFGRIDGTNGSFRKANVTAGGRYFPGYDKVEGYTNQLVKNVNDNLPLRQTQEDQLTLSFSAHYDLVRIHPFYDGNGRTSRLLMTYIQSLYKLPLSIVFQEDKQEYLDALRSSDAGESNQPFTDFMYKQYRKQLTQEIEAYNVAMKKDIPPKNKRGIKYSIFF